MSKKNSSKGNGLGAWQHHGAMARSTRTKTKVEKRRARDRRNKQRGWR
jgi:hypothetical protein